jgi:hypothetical protein
MLGNGFYLLIFIGNRFSIRFRPLFAKNCYYKNKIIYRRQIMTENYIRDYMRLAYQEAVNVQRLFVDAMKSTGVKERLWAHLDAFQRNVNTMNEFMYHTSEVENAAQYVKFLEQAKEFRQLVDEKLKKHAYTRTDRDSIYDAVMALDSAMPLIL